jgi:hypothetical protein
MMTTKKRAIATLTHSAADVREAAFLEAASVDARVIAMLMATEKVTRADVDAALAKVSAAHATSAAADAQGEPLKKRANSLIERYHAEIAKPGEIDWGKHHEFASEAISILGDMLDAPTQAAAADSQVGLSCLEKLRALMVRLGVFPGEGMELFAAQLEHNLYSTIRAANSLLDGITQAAAAEVPALKAPEGEDPMRYGDRSIEASVERLTEAYCVQQPSPIPDQMALVWRFDIGRLRNDWIRLNAWQKSVIGERAADTAADNGLTDFQLKKLAVTFWKVQNVMGVDSDVFDAVGYARAIEQAARASIPDRGAVIEECARVCDEQADFYERLNPKKGSGSYMGKLAVSRQRDCARLIRALVTHPTGSTGDSQ